MHPTLWYKVLLLGWCVCVVIQQCLQVAATSSHLESLHTAAAAEEHCTKTSKFTSNTVDITVESSDNVKHVWMHFPVIHPHMQSSVNVSESRSVKHLAKLTLFDSDPHSNSDSASGPRTLAPATPSSISSSLSSSLSASSLWCEADLSHSSNSSRRPSSPSSSLNSLGSSSSSSSGACPSYSNCSACEADSSCVFCAHNYPQSWSCEFASNGSCEVSLSCPSIACVRSQPQSLGAWNPPTDICMYLLLACFLLCFATVCIFICSASLCCPTIKKAQIDVRIIDGQEALELQSNRNSNSRNTPAATPSSSLSSSSTRRTRTDGRSSGTTIVVDDDDKSLRLRMLDGQSADNDSEQDSDWQHKSSSSRSGVIGRRRRRCYRFGQCFSFFLVLSFIGLTISGFILYPQMPVYSMCNTRVDWYSIFNGIWQRVISGAAYYTATVDMHVAVYNVNRFDVRVDSADLEIIYQKLTIGSGHMSGIHFIGGAVTDLVFSTTMTVTGDQVAKLLAAHLSGQLLIDMSMSMSADILYWSRSLLSMKTNFTAHVDYEQPTDRTYCMCPE